MSEGSGYVGFFSDTIPYAGGVCYTNAVATPSEGAQFAGWYTPDGTLVSSEPEFELGIFNMANWAWFSECEQPELIARFVGGITLGDEVSITFELTEVKTGRVNSISHIQ